VTRIRGARIAGFIGLSTALISATGCARRSRSAHESALVTRDSLVGVVVVTGTSFEEQLALRSVDRSIRLRPTAEDVASLKRLSGLEVLVRGVANEKEFLVSSFVVLRADGQPVVDGLLRRDGDRFVLETATGARISVGAPPAAFQSLVGARIWIGGSLDRGPNVYGIIMPPPRE
jgi:hypothetical protein